MFTAILIEATKKGPRATRRLTNKAGIVQGFDTEAKARKAAFEAWGDDLNVEIVQVAFDEEGEDEESVSGDGEEEDEDGEAA